MGWNAVLFDVGCVIVRSPFELAGALERRRGLAAGSLGLWGPLDPARDPLWRELAAGRLDEDEYWRRQGRRLAPVLGLPGEDPERELILELFVGPAEEIIRPEVAPTLDVLEARGLRRGILSNHLALFHRPETIGSTLRRFDPVVDLSFAPFRKPDPRAFALALERLGDPDPATVIHVDDQPVHVAGADAAGLRGFFFDLRHPASSFAALLELVSP